MKRIILSLFIVLLLSGCFQNVRHKIGITTKPFAKNDGLESSTKLNYSIIFGVVRPKEDDD
jgi:uncharacterized protein YceK